MREVRKALKGARLLNRSLGIALYRRRRKYKRVSKFKRSLQLLIFILMVLVFVSSFVGG